MGLKLMLGTSKTVQGTFAAVFLLTIATCLVRCFIKFQTLSIILVVCLGLAFTAFCVWFYGFLKSHAERLSQKQIDRAFFAVALLVLAAQIMSLVFLYSEPVNDLSYVDTAARNLSKSWSREDLYLNFPSVHYGYFARYPNNAALLIIVTLIYAATDALFGTTPEIVPMIINLIGIHISFWLMYLISKKVSKDKVTPLYCAMYGALFSVFYTYTTFYYTDSMSMPFVMLAVWLFLKGMDAKKLPLTIAYSAISAVCVIIGYKIKGSVVILAVAFYMYYILSFKRCEIKRFLTRVLSFTLALVISAVGATSFIGSFNLTWDDSESYYREFPVTHWVMMGLNDRGGYNSNDFWITESQGDYDQKVEENLKQIKQRLADYGFSGFLVHLAKKVSYTWSDGTFSIAKFLKNGDSNAVRSFVTESYIFKGLCTIFHISMLLALLASFAIGSVTDSRGREVLLRIIVIGAYLFFLIWETRARYLVNFTPLMLILSADSFKNVSEFVRNRRNERKLRVKFRTKAKKQMKNA